MAHDLALMIATILSTYMFMDCALVELFVRHNYPLCAICETYCIHLVLVVRHIISTLCYLCHAIYFLDY